MRNPFASLLTRRLACALAVAGFGATNLASATELLRPLQAASAVRAAPPRAATLTRPDALARPKNQQSVLPAQPLTIEWLKAASHVANPPRESFLATPGTPLVVQGTGLDRLKSVVVHYARQVGGRWEVNTNALRTFPVTPTVATPTRLEFKLPEASLEDTFAPVVLVLGNGTTTASTAQAVMVSSPVTPRVITDAQPRVARAGQRITLTGTGFGATMAYSGVEGGYLGSGALDTAANPRLGIINRGATAVQLMLPADCNREGLVMLMAPSPGGGSPALVVGTPPIKVACLSSDPAGRIAGTSGIQAAAGATITITGTNLRYVTSVRDNRNQQAAFRVLSAGDQPGPQDRLEITLPATAARPELYSYFLGSALLNPQVFTPVGGYVEIR